MNIICKIKYFLKTFSHTVTHLCDMNLVNNDIEQVRRPTDTAL